MPSRQVTSHAKSETEVLRNLAYLLFTTEVPSYLNTHVCIQWVPCMPERVLLDMLYLAWPMLDEQTHMPQPRPPWERSHYHMLRELSWAVWTQCVSQPVETLSVLLTTASPAPALVHSKRGVCLSIYLSLLFFNCYIFLGISDNLESKRKIILPCGG